jgi:hypothetical protein
MSRPSLPRAVRKSEYIQLSVTRSEKKAIEEAVKNSTKSTIADWLREIIKKECPGVLT